MNAREIKQRNSFREVYLRFVEEEQPTEVPIKYVDEDMRAAEPSRTTVARDSRYSITSAATAVVTS